MGIKRMRVWRVACSGLRVPCKLSYDPEHGIQNTKHGTRTVLMLTILGLLGFTPAFPDTPDDKLATFFMGRVKYSSNDGNDCGGVGQDLMRLVSRASTLKVQEERKVRLTDSDLFETPFLFMNGHNDFVLTEAELENLRKLIPAARSLPLLAQLARGAPGCVRIDYLDGARLALTVSTCR